MSTAGRIGDTAVTITGDGPALVLVHGMGLNRAMWQGQTEALTARYRVIRYDLLGHGKSDARPGPYAMQDFVDQLSSLLDRLDVARCGMIGFSLGGLIVQAFTLAHPDRVAALGILNAGYDRSPAERAGMIERLAVARDQGFEATIDMALDRWFTPEFAACRPEVIETVRHWMQANDPAVYPEIYRVLAYGDQPLARTVAAIRCPTLVMACADDPGNSPDMARRLAAKLSRGSLAVIPGLRHMGLLEDPPAINAVLLPFLAEHYPASGL